MLNAASAFLALGYTGIYCAAMKIIRLAAAWSAPTFAIPWLLTASTFFRCQNVRTTDGPSPAPAASAKVQSPPADSEAHLHNVLQVIPKLISGSMPESDADFAALRAMGVRTILSVDGARPDVAAARAHGMRYVHMPIGYHGIETKRKLELARAIRDLPGPIYLHCHHGKHRGPAAAAAAGVLLGELTTEEATGFMRKAGTAENYRGLYACVMDASPAPTDAINGVAADFPEVAPIPGFVKAMAEAQTAYDRLALIRDANWTVPPDHPDLVAITEAGVLEGLMRAMQDDPAVAGHPAEFARLLRGSLELTQAFEAALKRGDSRAELSATFARVGASCRDCHVLYRDNR